MCQIVISTLLLMLLPLSYSTEQQCKLKIDPSTSLTSESFVTQTGDFSSTCEVVLLPGNYTLSSEIRISVNELSVQGNENTNIYCNESGRLEFEDLYYLRLMSLRFIDCQNIAIRSLEQISIENCTFLGTAGGTTTLLFSEVKNAAIIDCFFSAKNNETADAVFITSSNSSIVLSKCMLTTDHGRLLFADNGSNVIITKTEFCNSTVTQVGDHPALIKVLNSNITMVGSSLINNTGSLIMSARNCPLVNISDSSFVHNSPWECTFCVSHSNVILVLTNISENSGNFSVFYVTKTYINIKDGVHYTKNSGSFLVISSTITFEGMNTFENCIQNHTRATSENYQAKGTLTVIQSTINFNGTTHFLDNYSDKSGGALYISESVIQIQGNLTVAKNFAQNGGGAFFYLSRVIITGNCFFTENRANSSGGGIHAIGTTIILGNLDSQWESLSRGVIYSLLNVSDNEANISGGGLHFEVNSKLYGIESRNFNYTMEFARNKAKEMGGAIYVNDSTYPGVCASTSFASYDVQTECFFQALHDHEDCGKCQLTHHINFIANSAENGSILYGGLLDRCTVSFQASVYNKTLHSTKHVDPVYGLSYFQNEGGINSSLDRPQNTESISSHVLRVCFCRQNEIFNCENKPPAIHVQKGEEFNITVAAVDQVNKTSRDVAIRSHLKGGNSRLVNGQLNYTRDGCTNFTFNIHSDQNSIDLVLYVDKNPCEDSGLSRSTVTINFKECTCPIGFQDTNQKDVCECVCHEKIKRHVQMCNSLNQTFQKKRNSWIGYHNESNNSGYLVYPNCPYDFCRPPTLSNYFINLNQPNGADIQCDYNRAGLLCGQCKDNLQLSLSTPSCIDCTNSSSATYFVGLLLGGINGVVIIGILLILNLTVAQGTVNGLIFYANILLMGRSIFLSSMSPNFFTVFVHLLNTQLGLDRCYHSFGKFDEYAKMWHRLLFPLYMLFLVAAVIILSKYSSKCAHIIGKRNPVATLATVILLIYTELLQTAMDALSFVSLEYPNRSHRILWRPDASVEYLRGRHIPLFLAGVIIMMFGIAYTFLLFTWQWLTRAHNCYMFRWIRNTKINSFVDAYHAPYKPKYRYWTGLLLLVRFLFNITVTVNKLSDPEYKLLIIIILTSFLILIKACLGDHIYKQKLLDYTETICYFNLLLLSLANLKYKGDLKTNGISIRISVSVTFVITLCVLLYHTHSFLCKTRIYKRTSTRVMNWLYKRREKEYFYSAKYKLTHNKNNPSSTEVSLSNLIECSNENTTERCSSLSNSTPNMSSLREPLIEDS